MTKKLHFAWFGAPGAHYWNLPSAATYDWRQGALYMDIARMCESVFMDMVLFADIPAVPTAFGGSNDHYVKYGQEVHLDPAPILAMMGGVTRHLGLGATLSTSLYPPFLLARMMGTLDHLTAGLYGMERCHLGQRGRGTELRPGRSAGTRRAVQHRRRIPRSGAQTMGQLGTGRGAGGQGAGRVC